jgi:hypothetical protein
MACSLVLNCQTNVSLNVGMLEAKQCSVLPTVVDVLQVGVLLDIDANPPAVEQNHQDGDVLRTEKEENCVNEGNSRDDKLCGSRETQNFR